MPTTFLIADTHFGHAGVCRFTGPDGQTPLRPWNTIQEMDQALIDNWNSVVKPKDRVYHLGDVLLNRRAFSTLYALNGEKVLIKGNHDTCKLEEYLPFFKDIRAYHEMDNMILSHIPVHDSQKARYRANIHGHTHANKVLDKFGKPDPWYKCVSVEQINFTPVAFDELR